MKAKIKVVSDITAQYKRTKVLGTPVCNCVVCVLFICVCIMYVMDGKYKALYT